MVRDKWFISADYKTASTSILYDNLASLRARIGITQEELANVIGVSRQTYYAIETGTRKMTWVIYLTLVFFFNSVEETSEMLKELRIFPIDLVVRFNEQLEDVEPLDV
ncbi:helix-turn-helix transcriptional regulator [Catonella massiliensis]|uniref:Helix-turn-helix domain-containing protein n=1 Tax=Catonella massiliensis TaxID=2799636 RepID=A0ABS1J0W9_9FIRM|nr:helix-turn-helix domain-containing protein [Catonella massiliensis]MBK5897792.1 helix-turn-helix domain-containing protein [Catonella massiliensis]